MTQNNNGENTVGLTTNDRITSYNRMMMMDRSSRKFLRKSTTGGVGWPIILALVLLVTSLLTIGVTVYCYKKKHGLSWKCNEKNEDDDSEDNVSVIVDSHGPAA